MTQAPYTPLQIANTFINLAMRDNRQGGEKIRDLTPLKLIKLTYFFYAWYLAACDERPFAEAPQAWRHGPVFPSVYAAFAHHKRSHIDEYYVEHDLEDDFHDTPLLTNEHRDKMARAIVVSIWHLYKKLSAWDLREITHEKGGPWHKVWDGGAGDKQIIDLDDAIKERARKAISGLSARA